MWSKHQQKRYIEDVGIMASSNFQNRRVKKWDVDVKSCIINIKNLDEAWIEAPSVNDFAHLGTKKQKNIFMFAWPSQ